MTSFLVMSFLAMGDFALSEHIIKAYPGVHGSGSTKRTFNERLDQSRVVVENSFGILSSRFRRFKQPIGLIPEKATLITEAFRCQTD